MKSINSNHTKADCEIIVFSYLLIISISLLTLSSVISQAANAWDITNAHLYI